MLSAVVERGQALLVVATECSVDVLCRFPVVEFAGHVVEGVLEITSRFSLRLAPLLEDLSRSGADPYPADSDRKHEEPAKAVTLDFSDGF
ncbi:MAG: hypothetical protein OXB90_00735 [Acidimicrobiaceae bacterium]|nr:hypothetical protein [Acidimicrobiaceae bacterium]